MGTRPEQIVDAALELLASVPVDKLSTRAVAKQVGVSQPALFRHFRSRDEILAAVVVRVTDRLRQGVHRILDGDVDPMAAVAELAGVLFNVAREHPGVPALFLHDSSGGPDTCYRRPLKELVGMPTALVGELVESASRNGQLPRSVDASGAGTLFVALVQGMLLQARRSGRAPDPTADAATAVSFWSAAVRAGQPTASVAGSPAAPHSALRETALQELDVRPTIADGGDPLAEILETVRSIRPDGALVLTAPFLPRPLLALLAGRGWRHEVRQAADALWIVDLLAEAAPDPIDLTELETPEPLEQVLARTAALAPGGSALYRLPRFPSPLLAHLEERGWTFEVAETEDAQALLYVRVPEEAR